MQGIRTTAAAGPPPRLRRGGRRGVALAAAGLLSVGGFTTLATGLAQAAVPTFPDNVVVFPDRDFVTIEGYQDHIGEKATVTVTRGADVIGSAVGTVAEGDVAFEINHPGGVCWGAGGGPAVTPDIQKGDKVSIKFADGTSGDTTTSTGTATTHATLSGSTVTVKGTYGADVNPSQAEVRIVNPDLTAEVNRRDVRAVPGGMTPAPKGGYSSDLAMSGGTFTATFVFDTVKAAQIAAGTQVERFMSWQVEDADANRQGLTISEFGEFGGPGMGGCPAGPADVAPPKASYSVTRSVDKTKLAVKWTPAEAPAGTPAVTNYNVQALKADGTFVGSRVAATATGATLTVEPAVTDYKVEVRSMAGAKMGDPFELAPATPGNGGEIPADQTQPKLTPTPAAGGSATAPAETSSLALATEAAADVYFTTDGSPVLVGDLPSDTASLYKAPIAITKATQIHAVAIDRAGNISTQVVGFYAPPAGQQPGALTAPVVAQPAGADLGKTSIKLGWAKVANATSYQVTAYTDAGVPLPAAQQPSETQNLTQTVGGLAGSTPYRFTVVAVNAGGKSEPSKEVRAVTAENLTIGTAKWKTGDFRVTGTATATSGTVTVHRANGDGTAGAQIGTLTATLTAAAAPATGTTYDWRLRTGVPTTNPGKIVVKNTGTGSVSAVFTATNG